MSKLDILSIQKRASKIFKTHEGIISAFLFGSFSKGTQTDNSDLDFLVEVDSSWNIMDLVKLQMELEKEFERQIDVVDRASIVSDWAIKSILNAPTNIRII